jgi:hypothetical protein
MKLTAFAENESHASGANHVTLYFNPAGICFATGWVNYGRQPRHDV